ncbi:cytochrome P450 9e2-like [Anticarsia gemmatalis]|uniref:cytochrome P450 9e2-like n=1 Tax=Anticarsia gemmatalis TaxID=129554 RepID=UPI003F7715B5
MIFFIWVFLLLIALVLYYKEVYSRFQKHGVKHFTPLPLLGNVGELVTRQAHIVDSFDKLYYNFPEERFVGRYEFTRPIVLLRDLDLIKKITVKDFEHFLDHRPLVDENMDPLFGRNLFSLRGQEWKDMRSTLSPAFTSSKMRAMVPFMLEVSDVMTKSLKKQIKASGVDYVDVECKDLMSRYANDVIATCAFGLKVDSHNDANNEFYVIGKETATFGFSRILIFLGYTSFPNLMKKLNLRLFSTKISNFFSSIILGTMKEREQKNILRPDMIHLLMEAKKGKLSFDEKTSEENAGFATVEESDVGKENVNRDWSDQDLVAQAVLFFVAGFETVSSAMSFLLYELAVNPDVQDRLAQEIKDHDIQKSGKFDFNSIQNMPYLDMVVSEVLRLWPPAIGMDRLCIKDYNMGKPNSKSEEDYIIRKGEACTIPTWAFHHNPDYFPDPYKFDPERFSEENKHNIKPFTYVPFGLGPRNCIGSRFALCEIKVMTYQLLQQMELSPCEKTPIPPVLARDTFNLRLQGGHWARFRARQ